jgi:mannosyltransferase
LALFVAPQRWEGFGLTPLEAMATGVPVVAADVGAFSELIEEGVTGTVIARDDLAAMVAASGRMMDEDEARQAAGAAGLKRVRTQFALQGEAEAIGRVYEQVWGRAGK